MSIQRAALRDYRTLRYRLFRNAVKKRAPLGGMFELTYRCNHRCVYCYAAQDSLEKELTTIQVKSILEQFRDAGGFYMAFTGGEIFTRPDIFDIIFHAKRCGIQIILKTNGALIDKNKADTLARLGINNVHMSLLGAREETFDSITQVPGSFRRFKNTLELLRERRIPVKLTTCVIKSNIEEIREMKRFAENRGLVFNFDPLITPKNNGSKRPLNFRLSDEEIFVLQKKLYPHKGRGKIKNGQPQRERVKKEGSSEFFKCNAGKTAFTITPYGRMKVCVDIAYPMADVIANGFAGAWKETRMFRKSFKPGRKYKCQDCDLRMYCRWCPARGLLEGGDLDRCVPFYKRLATMWAKDAKR